MSDTTRGIYGKYLVQRTDGRSAPGEKHHGCQYFILDLNHDKHAIAALRAYAQSCSAEYPALAADLRAQVWGMENGDMAQPATEPAKPATEPVAYRRMRAEKHDCPNCGVECSCSGDALREECEHDCACRGEPIAHAYASEPAKPAASGSGSKNPTAGG